MYVTGAVVSPDSDLQLLSECVGSEMEKAPGILSHRWRELRQLHNVLWRPVAAWSRKSSFRLWSSRWETRCGEACGGWEQGRISGQVFDHDCWYITRKPGSTYVGQGHQLRLSISLNQLSGEVGPQLIFGEEALDLGELN